jgi:hypothetical protein
MHPLCVPCSTKKQIKDTECGREDMAVIVQHLHSKVFKFVFNSCLVLS